MPSWEDISDAPRTPRKNGRLGAAFLALPISTGTSRFMTCAESFLVVPLTLREKLGVPLNNHLDFQTQSFQLGVPFKPFECKTDLGFPFKPPSGSAHSNCTPIIGVDHWSVKQGKLLFTPIGELVVCAEAFSLEILLGRWTTCIQDGLVEAVGAGMDHLAKFGHGSKPRSIPIPTKID